MTTGLLFVCRGNECRSPVAHLRMAHVLAAAGDGHPIDVTSAGLSARPDRPVHPVCAKLLADLGQAVGEFGSRPLGAGMVRAADVVVAMTRAELNEVLRRAPSALPVTVTLGELARATGLVPPAEDDTDAGERLRDLVRWTVRYRGYHGAADTDIPDPAGRRTGAVRATAVTVIRHVDAVAAHLTTAAVPAGRTP